jgi:AraC family transcriptional regulator of adaptative response / DNA-3-methyladenine glycosylase II
VARCRRLFDLDADPVAVDDTLARDPALRPGVESEPGMRVPRAVDGLEMAFRAVIGQQISVAGARTILARLVAATRHDPRDHGPRSATDGLSVATSQGHEDLGVEGTSVEPFPTAAELLAVPDEAYAMPAARRRTLRALTEAVARGDVWLDPAADRAETEAALLAVPGIGPWTAQYVAMRALGDPDVLLPTDLGVRRGAAAAGLADDPATLGRHAATHWAPWRSYATIRLWRTA